MADLPALVERVLGTLGYPGLLLLTLLENLFPPLPSEVILPLAGFMVSLGRMQLVAVLLVSTAGSLLGGLVLYAVGRIVGDMALRELLRRHGRRLGMSEAGYDRAAHLFRRHSAAVLFWGRFVPGVRSLVALPAGVSVVPLPAFLLWTVLGALCWNGALVGAGLLLGRNWSRVAAAVGSYDSLVLWAVGISLIGAIAYWGCRSWRRRLTQRAAGRTEAASPPHAPRREEGSDD